MVNKVNSYIIRHESELDFIFKYLYKIKDIDKESLKTHKKYLMRINLIDIIIYEKSYHSTKDGKGYEFGDIIGYDYITSFEKNKKLKKHYNVIEVKDLIRLTKLKKIYGK